MNWRKGFFRAWIVFTVLWIAGVGAFVYGTWETYLDASHQLAALGELPRAPIFDNADKARLAVKGCKNSKPTGGGKDSRCKIGILEAIFADNDAEEAFKNSPAGQKKIGSKRRKDV